MSEARSHQEAPSIPFEDLPDRLRRSRKRMGWDQSDIAARLGVHQRTVANYETGQTEPKLAMLMSWANVTNVPVDWLTYGITPAGDCPQCGTSTMMQPHQPLRGVDTRSRCFSEDTLVSEPQEGGEIIDLHPAEADIEAIIERLDSEYFAWTGNPNPDARILYFPSPPLSV